MNRLPLSIARLRRPRVLFTGVFLLASLSLLALFVQGTWADLKGPQPAEHQITLAVAGLLKQQHLSKHPLDDEISQRCLKMFLKPLDPMKVYFTQSDIDAFNRRMDELDDLVKKGDISFAYTVFQQF